MCMQLTIGAMPIDTPRHTPQPPQHDTTRTDTAAASQTHPAALRVFDLWAHRMRASGELGTVTVATYRTIWGVWLDWLGTRQRDWLNADADLVLAFLNGPSPSLHHHRAAIRTDRLANFTQQRYWRVLRAVYAQAVESGWLAANPVLDVEESRRPVVLQRSRLPQLLPPAVLAGLQDPQVVTACYPPKRGNAWCALRDRAAMLVLAHCGITTRELMGLRGDDVRMAAGQLWPLVEAQVQASDANGAAAQEPPAGEVWLEVTRDLETVGRRLVLNEAVLACLWPWLLERQRVLAQRLAHRLGAGVATPAQWRRTCLEEPLFMSRQRSDAQIAADRGLAPARDAADTAAGTATADSTAEATCVSLLPPMEASNVYCLVKKGLEGLLGRTDLPVQDPRKLGISMATGAAIIRNTVLKHWLDTLGLSATLELGGLRSPEYLRSMETLAPVDAGGGKDTGHKRN